MGRLSGIGLVRAPHHQQGLAWVGSGTACRDAVPLSGSSLAAADTGLGLPRPDLHAVCVRQEVLRRSRAAEPLAAAASPQTLAVPSRSIFLAAFLSVFCGQALPAASTVLLAASGAAIASCAVPSDAWTHYELARLLEDEREWAEAVEQYRLFLALAPDHELADDVQWKIANILYRRLGHGRESLKECQTLINLYVRDTDWTRQHGYSKWGDDAQLAIADLWKGYFRTPEKALEEYQRLIDEYTGDSGWAQQHGDSEFADNAHLGIADIYLLYYQDYERARTEYQSVINHYPLSDSADDAQFGIARIWDDFERDPERAVEEYLKFMEIYAGDSEWTEMYGVSDLADDAQWRIAVLFDEYLNVPKRAAQAYQRLIDNYPDSENIEEARERLAELCDKGYCAKE